MRPMLTEVASSGVHPLRRWRKKKKLTLQYIGDACGRSAAAISRYETGVDMPPYSVAALLAALTNGAVKVADFYPEPARPAAPLRGSAGRQLAVTSAAGRKAAATRKRRKVAMGVEA